MASGPVVTTETPNEAIEFIWDYASSEHKRLLEHFERLNQRAAHFTALAGLAAGLLYFAAKPYIEGPLTGQLGCGMKVLLTSAIILYGASILCAILSFRIRHFDDLPSPADYFLLFESWKWRPQLKRFAMEGLAEKAGAAVDDLRRVIRSKARPLEYSFILLGLAIGATLLFILCGIWSGAGGCTPSPHGGEDGWFRKERCPAWFHGAGDASRGMPCYGGADDTGGRGDGQGAVPGNAPDTSRHGGRKQRQHPPHE